MHPTRFPSDSDFVPLALFPLAYRWTDSRYDVFPPEVIATIRPLSVTAARTFSAMEALWLDRGLRSLAPRLFDTTTRPTNGGTAEVTDWLTQRLVLATEPVVVSWSSDQAIGTTAATFCAFWSAFCFPVSDDVTVWPESQEWGLVYHHWEQFEFGIRRPK